jgi:adenylate cyclase
MPPENLERRLAAILSADVAGYSRLMGDDEEATIRTLTDYRRVIADLTQQYRGRVVDSPGDNLLAEFASVLDAVNCAVEIQRELAERNADLPEDRRMEFRIGINLGDVVTEGERIYGDGVNIAARMEGLAEGRGICLSGTVYDAIGKKIGLEYDYLGEQEVKNIAKPVRAYRVVTEPDAVGRVTREKKAKFKVWRKVAIALGVIVVLLVGAAGMIWNFYFRLPDVRGIAGSKKDFALSDGPSIAVLPFVNMSGDPEQEYFSDGLTENIIAGLSSDRRLLVIARNSTFVYKGMSVDIQEAGRKLGAQYVVEGSVQKTEDRVRITAQLIDAKTGHHVWSDRYDRDLKDIFALQDEITIKIIHAVGMKIVTEERFYYSEEFLPPSGNLEVYLKTLRAREYFWRMNKESNILARQEAEQAIALDPQYSVPYGMLAWTHLLDLPYRSGESPLISLAQANRYIKKALELDPENYYANLGLSYLYLYRREHDKAIATGEAVIASNPNAADAYAQLGYVLSFAGRADEGIKLIEKAKRLNPIPPRSYLLALGFAYRFLGRYEDAIEVHKEIVARSHENLFAHVWLTAAYSALGFHEKALQQGQEVLKIDPTISLDQIAETLPLKDKAEAERFIADLRNAGLK